MEFGSRTGFDLGSDPIPPLYFDRFLPDKAIDLIDEAAAQLRVEINSMPTEMDETSRRILQLEIEKEALKKEKDEASRDRLEKLSQELAELNPNSTASNFNGKRRNPNSRT